MFTEVDVVTFARSTLGDLADRPVITVEECARVLGIGRSAAYEAARIGGIPSWRIGRRVVVPVAALVARLAGVASRSDEMTNGPVRPVPLVAIDESTRDLQAGGQ